MDILSDILRTIHLQSSVYFRKNFYSPWGMDISSADVAQFHMIVKGQCLLYYDGLNRPMNVSTGDIIIFPFGDKHWLADAVGQKRVPGMQVLEEHKKNKPLFRGEDFSATLICGHFEFDKEIEHPFIQSLPRLIYISGTEERQYTWLDNAVSVIIHETDSGNPGWEIVSNRLAEILLIQVLRTFILKSENSSGYLSALNDAYISKALSLVHNQPQNRWSLEGLAKQIGMSRTAFAKRFKQLVGSAPMEYITKWRMIKAREMLIKTKWPLIEISERVGYKSEAAFSKAFKRNFHQTPAVIRRSIQT